MGKVGCDNIAVLIDINVFFSNSAAIGGIIGGIIGFVVIVIALVFFIACTLCCFYF